MGTTDETKWLTCLDFSSLGRTYTGNGIKELTDRCAESCRLCRGHSGQQVRTTTTMTSTTTTVTTNTVTTTYAALRRTIVRPCVPLSVL